MYKKEENENKAVEIIFSYEVKKDNKVFIYWYDKLIKMLSGENAKKFLFKIEGADTLEAQQIMARLTANIKRKKDGDINTIVIRGSYHTRNKNNY